MLLIGVADATAQWGAGFSFERRSDDPQNGVGVHIEHDLLGSIPIFFLRTRAHFSYFSEENTYTFAGIAYQRSRVETYDFGGAFYGGASLGLFAPYVGLGLGSDQWNFYENSGDSSPTNETSSFYYYGIVGVALSPIPVVKPFIEYRVANYNDISQAREEIGSGNARFHFGITFRF
jgi:hypothetical protein